MNRFSICAVVFCLFQGSILLADVAVEGRVGAFIPSNHLFRDIYGTALPHYQVEVSKTGCGCLDFWTSFNYARASAKISYCQTRTCLNLYTWDIGVSYYIYRGSCLKSYLGLGPTVGWTHLDNRTCAFTECVRRRSAGCVVKWGVLYEVFCKTYADFYVQYIYQPVNFERCHTVGGTRVGLGLKRAF